MMITSLSLVSVSEKVGYYDVPFEMCVGCVTKRLRERSCSAEKNSRVKQCLNEKSEILMS